MDVNSIEARIRDIERQISQLSIDLIALERAKAQATQEQIKHRQDGKTLLQG